MWAVWPWRCKFKANLHKCCITDNEPLTGLAKSTNEIIATFCCIDSSAIVKREQFNFSTLLTNNT